MAAAGLRTGADSASRFGRDGNTFIPAFLPGTGPSVTARFPIFFG
jgi:hypothetical protein